MYILRPDLGEQNVDLAIAKYQTLLQGQGVETIAIQHRGKRRLAYEIANNREGVYIQMNYTAKPGSVEVMEKAMRLSDDVIRYMTVRLDSVEEIAEIAEAPEAAIADPAPEPAPKPAPEPAPKPASEPAPKPASEPTPEIAPEPTPEIAPEPIAASA